MLGMQEEGHLEVGEKPPGENWAKDGPELEQGVEEAGWD